MSPEKKSGYFAMLIGILGYIGILYLNPKNDMVTYLSTAVFTPFIIYAVSIFLGPKSRREKIGQIPFRGW
ncbi:conserved hypothetical protein [Methanococcus vannielii SB]|jgi:energy-converting hydrogenase A subunit I|uniref:Uncharacterized protein n=1 Tax=Methanococcus vannielii (strain ATCC 35089 / DSM 1224 / JCM 13029 / OCM 148 / SB) TaxID=406327 RepID=A6UQA1_METVS|nr:hypothetical protein [Methanococcus vannielii]ABR54673.1 conserved hypothetical protein [Methanococcus vannielii SB]